MYGGLLFCDGTLPSAAGLPNVWISEIGSVPMYEPIVCADCRFRFRRTLTKPPSAALGACASGASVLSA